MTGAGAGHDRRAFLGLLIGGATVAGGVGLARRWADGGAEDRVDPLGADVVPSVEAATRAVGERYLAVTPGEATAAALRSSLPPTLRDTAVGERVAAVRRQVQADFRRGEVVEVDGWILSRTECRLAALETIS